MEIVSNYGVYNPAYRSVTAVKRTQPVNITVNQPVSPETKEKQKYNWKAIAVVAGVSALALLGIKNRKAISKMAQNMFKKEEKPFVNPNMYVAVNNGEKKVSYFPSSQIRETFEPEKLSDLMLKKDKINQKRHKSIFYIDQEGKPVRKVESMFYAEDKHRSGKGFNFQNRDFSSQRMNTRTNQGAGYTAGDAVDDAINFAIIDDIVNGGNEVKGAYDFVKNAFKGKNAETVMDKGMSSVDETVGTSGSAVGDFFSNIGERTSDFMDDVFKTASDMADSFGDGLGDMADSIGDII